jgi:hypothetical protein
MYKLFFIAALLVVSASACRIFGRLTSTTQIETGQMFVLGKGSHGSYRATVKNISPNIIEVFTSKDNEMVSVGKLGKGMSTQLRVPNNTTAYFKNLGKSMAFIEINLTGDTDLSMGYQGDVTKTLSMGYENSQPVPALPDTPSAGSVTDENIVNIKAKARSNALFAKAYTVRGPAARPFSFGVEIGGRKTMSESLPIGTTIEDKKGNVVHTFMAEDDGLVVRLK